MPFAQVNDIRLYYETHGEGEALMLLSGTGMSGDHWHVFQVPAFSQAYQVITFDYRGVGQSDKPDAPYSTRLFAADAVGLLDALGVERAHVMGHSMGGRVAQWIALDHPERVRSLILSSSGPGQYAPEVDVVRGVPLKQAVEMIEMGYEQWWQAHFADDDFMFPPEVRAAQPELLAQRRQMAANARPPLRPYLRHVIARQQHETTAMLDQIEAPTLVIAGSKDTTVGGTGNHFEAARVLAERIPHAELVVMEGAAHGYLWQMPDEANRIVLDFLRRVKE
ncbi:MAG: alpha/beta hydrolase [Anaerolineae bacterium]